MSYNIRLCPVCSSPVPRIAWVDGKRRNLGKRKYCFNCSPFGKNNTRKLEMIDPATKGFCTSCGKPLKSKTAIRMCPVCQLYKRADKIRDKIFDILGYQCWVCGYDKGKIAKRVLEFHHMNPSEKEFSLGRNEMTNLAWERVVKEIKKCSLLCCRCHREIDAGIISTEEIEKIYKEKWKNIKLE